MAESLKIGVGKWEKKEGKIPQCFKNWTFVLICTLGVKKNFSPLATLLSEHALNPTNKRKMVGLWM